MDDFGAGLVIGLMIALCCSFLVGAVVHKSTATNLYEAAVQAGVGEYTVDARGETEFRFIPAEDK